MVYGLQPTRKKLIRVNKRCILDGVKGNALTCPVALAFREAGYPDTTVFYGKYALIGDKPYSRRRISPLAKRFIHRFDSNFDVSPFNFYAQVPV